MPKLNMTARSVAALKPPAKGQVDYFDESLPGFGLRISFGGKRAWTLLYRRRSDRLKRRLTIGPYPAISLAKAREIATANIREVALGKDPATEEAELRASETVADLAAEYLEKYAKPRKRSWQHDERTLRKDVLPVIGRVKARDVKRRDIVRLLNRVEERSPVMANRTLEILRKVFNWGISQDIVEANPCAGVEAPHEERQRDRVLSADEIRRFWTASIGEASRAGKALQLMLLTAQRKGEILTMRWQDIEEGREWWWTIPAEVAKNGLAHRVPLSKATKAILQAIREEPHDPLYVFPRRGGGAPATGSFVRKPTARIVAAASISDFVPHDLRRTAASYMTGMGLPRLTVAKLLNHAETSVTAVYDRHSYNREKKQALDSWAARLHEIVEGKDADSNVVPLAAGSDRA